MLTTIYEAHICSVGTPVQIAADTVGDQVMAGDEYFKIACMIHHPQQPTKGTGCYSKLYPLGFFYVLLASNHLNCKIFIICVSIM